MNAHDRFMAHRPTDVWLLLREITTTPTLSILIDIFNTFVSNVDDNSRHRVDVDTLHTTLCIAYQTKILSKAFKNIECRFKFPALTKLNVIDAQNALYNQQLNTEDLSLVIDILALRTALYNSSSDIMSKLVEMQNLIYYHLLEDNQVKFLDVKLMDCYMDGYLLHGRIHSTGRIDGEEVIRLFIETVQLWLTVTNHQDCQLLTLLLPKLIKVVTSCMLQPSQLESHILTRIWEMISTQESDPGEILSVLYLTAETWFPMDRVMDCDILIEQSVQEPLWLFLLNGLSSPTLQQRKEALFLIKRIVEFTDRWESRTFKLVKYEEIRPLLYDRENLRIDKVFPNEDHLVQQKNAFKENLSNYFLVLEALEEMQPHLVAPIFPLLQTLLRETIEQQNRGTALDIGWIQCAFSRILQHDNNGVVKEGLLNVFVLDPELCNDEFLDIVLDVLNNTHLYNTDLNDEEPTVVKELTRFLSSNETKHPDLVTRFILKASNMIWGPIALFYIIHALSMVKKVKSVWKDAELTAVRTFAEISSIIDCPMLRIGSQIELLEAMTHFATASLDLVTVGNTLSAFPTHEALNRGQLAWKRTSTWLCKLVKEDEAISFLEKISLQVTNGNSQPDVSMKSFSLMIMLFYDGRLILHSKLCPGITALRNLLDCLSGTKSRSNVNAESKNRSIELIHHLLDFVSLQDCILCELISNYADACLRFTFKSLRHVTENADIKNINTYILVTQQLFTAESLIIAKRDVLDHIERFEIESRNIIEDEEWSSSVRRFFGIKILHACLKTTGAKLRNYKFIGPLYNTHRTLKEQSSGDTDANETDNSSRKPEEKIILEYYKYVAELFHEYVKDQPVDDWLPYIDWIEEVSYLIQVGGKDVFAPLVGILSQVFYKEAVGATDMNDFKIAMILCWKSTLESRECHSTTEDMIDLILSSPFLECAETRNMIIECTREMVEKGQKHPELRIILLKGLKQVKGQYLCHFYDAILNCLLYGNDPDDDKKIGFRACSYILDCYQDVYPNYLSNMNINNDATTRAHAVTLLYKMITDDPTHAGKLLPLLYAKLTESQTNQDLKDSQLHHLQNRIMQVLLVLQPMLEKDDIKSLYYTLLCDNVLSKSSQPSVRMMQQWLLIRIYLEEDTLLPKIWDLFDQFQEERIDSLNSVITIVYHVALSLSTELQLDFVDSAFQYIFPCCMSHKSNLRIHAQAISSKLYDFASEKSYSTVTEKYKEFYAALTKGLQQGILVEITMKSKDDFNFTAFHPIDDYSLETLFYELPRLLNAPSDECISPQMFEKFGFKESNSHPLKLLNSRSDEIEAAVSVLNDSDDNGDCSNELQGKSTLDENLTPMCNDLSTREIAVSLGD